MHSFCHIVVGPLTWPCLYVLPLSLSPAAFSQPHLLVSPAVFPSLGSLPPLISHLCWHTCLCRGTRQGCQSTMHRLLSLPPGHTLRLQQLWGALHPGLSFCLQVRHRLSGFFSGIGLSRAVKQLLFLYRHFNSSFVYEKIAFCWFLHTAWGKMPYNVNSSHPNGPIWQVYRQDRKWSKSSRFC